MFPSLHPDMPGHLR